MAQWVASLCACGFCYYYINHNCNFQRWQSMHILCPSRISKSQGKILEAEQRKLYGFFLMHDEACFFFEGENYLSNRGPKRERLPFSTLTRTMSLLPSAALSTLWMFNYWRLLSLYWVMLNSNIQAYVSLFLRWKFRASSQVQSQVTSE